MGRPVREPAQETGWRRRAQGARRPIKRAAPGQGCQCPPPPPRAGNPGRAVMTRAAGLSVALFLLLLLAPAGAGADSDSDSEEDRESCRQRCQEGPAGKSNKKHDPKCCDSRHRCGCKTTTAAPGSLTSRASSAPGSPTSQRAAISASLGTGVLLLLLLALLGALWHRRRTREKESAVRIEPGYVLAQAPQQVAGTGQQARPEHLYEEVGDPSSGGVREQGADAVARIRSEYALAQAPKIPAAGGTDSFPVPGCAELSSPGRNGVFG